MVCCKDQSGLGGCQESGSHRHRPKGLSYGKPGRYCSDTSEREQHGKLGVSVRVIPGGFRLKLMGTPRNGKGCEIHGRAIASQHCPMYEGLVMPLCQTLTGLGLCRVEPQDQVGGWN